MQARQVVIYDPSHELRDLSDALTEGGWRLELKADPMEAAAWARSNDARVGLAVLREVDEQRLPALEELINSTLPTEWIAIVPPGALGSTPLCKLIDSGFHDFHTLPVDPEKLSTILGHAYGKAALAERIGETGGVVVDGAGEFIGQSAVMRRFMQHLRKLAAVDVPVLIRGESGTGKELAARMLHAYSSRSAKSFAVVDCAALPRTLIQSELFGYEKGAFTGAHHRNIGKIEHANGGTLLLDAIGELPPELQVNFVRFAQEKTIQRVGSHEPVPVDVRLIGATHLDLERAVNDGTFRSDLYYRLNVANLMLPPLREREGDIELLARAYLAKFVREHPGCRVKGFRDSTLQRMNTYEWPGNVRELVGRVRRGAIMSEGRLITTADLGLEKRGGSRSVATLEDVRVSAERAAIQQVLRVTRNNVSEAARQLGVSRMSLYRLMARFNISTRN